MPTDGLFPSFSNGHGAAKGKTLAALRQSQRLKDELVSLFGGPEYLPSSVMRARRPRGIDPQLDGPTAKRSYKQTSPGLAKSEDERLPDALRAAFSISGRGCQSGALSTFPQNIGRSMVLLYSEVGDTVFDPFAGHNSRLDLCVKEQRHYIGCDVSADFMAFNRQRAQQLREQYPELLIELHEGDSRKVPVDSRAADFSITSPPYYDIEYYGDEPEQLGKAATYQEFLEGLGEVLRENYRVLKWGAYAVWFVNDFRRKGKMHFYHMDVIRLAQSVGFLAHDLLVVDLGNSIRDCFLNQIVESKILPKRHEFGLVFRKPKKKHTPRKTS